MMMFVDCPSGVRYALFDSLSLRLEQERDAALMDAEHARGQLEELQRSMPSLHDLLAAAEVERDKARGEASRLTGQLKELRSEHEECARKIQAAEVSFKPRSRACNTSTGSVRSYSVNVCVPA